MCGNCGDWLCIVMRSRAVVAVAPEVINNKIKQLSFKFKATNQAVGSSSLSGRAIKTITYVHLSVGQNLFCGHFAGP